LASIPLQDILNDFTFWLTSYMGLSFVMSFLAKGKNPNLLLFFHLNTFFVFLFFDAALTGCCNRGAAGS
jgi:hypothetical protein